VNWFPRYQSAQEVGLRLIQGLEDGSLTIHPSGDTAPQPVDSPPTPGELPRPPFVQFLRAFASVGSLLEAGLIVACILGLVLNEWVLNSGNRPDWLAPANVTTLLVAAILHASSLIASNFVRAHDARRWSSTLTELMVSPQRPPT
jgi:hypothetical protein